MPDNDPLGILADKPKPKAAADPLGIIKKKEEGFSNPFGQFYGSGKSNSSPLLSSKKEGRPLSEKELQEQGYATVPQTQGNFIPATATEEFYGQAHHAAKRLTETILGSDDVMREHITKLKTENLNEQNATDAILNNRSDATAVNKNLNLSQWQPPKEKPEATQTEIDEAKMEALSDVHKAETYLNVVKKKSVDHQKRIDEDLYRVSAASRADDNKLRNEILPNIEAIREGEVFYKNGVLIKPQGPIDYFFTAREGMKETLDKYNFLTSTDNLAAIASELEAKRQSFNPDKPIPIPKGFLSENIGGLGGMPIYALAAGGVASGAVALVPGAEQFAPAAGKAATAIAGAKAFHDLEYAKEYERAFNEFRDGGDDPMEAARKAQPLAVEAGRVGATTGAAMGFVGVKAAGGGKILLSQGLKRSVGHFLKEAAVEGGSIGGLMGLGQYYKNVEAQKAGINRPLDSDVAEQIKAGAILAIAVKAVSKGVGTILDPKTYKKVVRDLPSVGAEHINEAIVELGATKQITPQESKQFAAVVENEAAKQATVPNDISERSRNRILDLKEKRDELEAQLEVTDKAFHKGINEEINGAKGKDGAPDKIGINQKIVELSKDKREPTELEKLIDEHEDKLGAYKEVAQDNPQQFFKEVADQAFGRQPDGSVFETPQAEKAVREQFGDAIVDKAKELFPMDTKKVESQSVPDESGLFDHDISDKADTQVKLTIKDSKGEPRDVFAKAGEIQRRMKNRHNNLADILNCLTK